MLIPKVSSGLGSAHGYNSPNCSLDAMKELNSSRLGQCWLYMYFLLKNNVNHRRYWSSITVRGEGGLQNGKMGFFLRPHPLKAG